MKTEITVLFKMIEHLYLIVADLNPGAVQNTLKDRLEGFQNQLIALEAGWGDPPNQDAIKCNICGAVFPENHKHPCVVHAL